MKPGSGNRRISTEALKKKIARDSELIIVQFKSRWNGACAILAPVYEELADLYKSKAKFFTIDVNEHLGEVVELGVMEIPAILFFKNGTVIDFVNGLVSKNIIIAKIETAIGG